MRKLGKGLLALTLAIHSLSLQGQDEQQTTGLQGFLRIPNYFNKEIIIEPNTFFALPGNITGFNFIQFYKEGFYGETSLNKKIYKGLDLKGKSIHANQIHTESGIGGAINFFRNSKNTVANIGIIPFWTNKDKKTIDMYFSQQIGDKYNITIYGEWNIAQPKIPFIYGEANISRTFTLGNTTGNFGYHTWLGANETVLPKFTPGAQLTINF